MKIKNDSLALGDEVPLLLHNAHTVGAYVNSVGSMPCSVCKAVAQSGQDVLTRDHFHASDLGSCKRQTYLIMTRGIHGSTSNPCFLADGHLHEASMLNNLMAGLGDGWKVRASKNTDEYTWDKMGFTIIGHTDGVLYNEDRGYLIECKSVKEWNYKNIKDKGEIPDSWYGQMQAYLLMLGLETGYLFVKHRETSLLLPPIRIDRDPEYLSQRLNALNEVHQRIIKGLGQPLAEYSNQNNSSCKFCPFGKGGTGECDNNV